MTRIIITRLTAAARQARAWPGQARLAASVSLTVTGPVPPRSPGPAGRAAASPAA
jgi:hypothetical protein